MNFLSEKLDKEMLRRIKEANAVKKLRSKKNDEK